jgi:hypothetical protein
MTTGQIRPFRREDISAVAEIHHEVFALADRMSASMLDRYRVYFDEVFLKPVAGREDLGSLVYEEEGRITGFIGSAPRHMIMNGRPAIARVSTQFVVHPRSRGVAGVKLLKAFFAGPQDFAIADESNSTARILWMGLGGATCGIPSILWNYPLRPWSFGLYALGQYRRTTRRLGRVAMPVAQTLDAITARVRLNPFAVSPPASTGATMDADALGACLSGMADKSLRPCYDSRSLSWVLARAAGARTNSGIEAVAVRSDKGQIIGWYVCSISTEGICEVLQFHAAKGSTERVFGHLLHHAAQSGATAVAGRLDYGLMEAVSGCRCLMHSGPWVLVQSPNPEIVRAFERGDAFFSRLEGEWCLRFQ